MGGNKRINIIWLRDKIHSNLEMLLALRTDLSWMHLEGDGGPIGFQ